jgi:Putative Actinobacterial Holin-X, holin superfamily III
MTEGHEPLSEKLDALEQAEARDRSLEGDLRDLAGHARGYAKAEIAFQKTRAAYAGKSGFVIALCLAAAFVFLTLTVMALVFGLIFALAPLLTAWGAVGVVSLGLLIAAGICLFAALRRWRTMTAVFEEDDAA